MLDRRRTVRVRTGARVARRSSTSSRRTACSSAASSSTGTAAASRRSARPPRRCWPRSPRPTRPTSTWRCKAARRAHSRVWGRMPGKERAKYLFRIARIIQERGRELAVLESIDNGKPIKETRDVDVPIAAAHFFYYAGWADKLEYAGYGDRVARRRRPGHPVELPAADAGVEDRAGAGLRQHRRAQAGRDDAADRAAVRRDLPAGRPARRAWSTSSPAPATPAARWSPTPTSTRSRSPARPRSAGRSRRAVAGTDKRVTLELGGKAANIVFDDAPLDQAVEGIVNGIFFNQGHVCCAGSRLLVQESVADEVLARLKRRMATLRVGDPLDKNTDVGAINSAEQLAKIRELSDDRRAGGRRALVAARASCPTTASGSRRRSSPASPRPTGSPARRSSGRCCRC